MIRYSTYRSPAPGPTMARARRAVCFSCASGPDAVPTQGDALTPCVKCGTPTRRRE